MRNLKRTQFFLAFSEKKLMKIVCFLFAFTSLSALAQSSSDIRIDVGVRDERIKLTCSQEGHNEKVEDLHYDFFICEKNGKKYLVRKIHEFENYSGFEYDPEKKDFNSLAINEIKDGEESIFKSVFINNGASEDLSKETALRDKYNELKAFQDNYNEIFGMDSITESERIKNLQLEMKLSLYEKLGGLEELYKKNQNLTIKTENGKELKCQRAGGETCLYYLCSGIGNYQISLKNIGLLNNEAEPYLISFNQNGLGPDFKISEIKIEDKLFYKNNINLKQSGSSFLPESLKASENSFRVLTDPILKITRKEDIKACNDPQLEKVEKELQNQLAKAEVEVGQTKLVQLIEDVDGTLKSRAIQPGEIDSQMCYMGGDVYFYDKDKYFDDIEKQFYGFSPEARIVPKKRLNEIYEFAIAQKDIPYAYYQDGCFARSHILCYRIEEQLGIDTEKIWAIGPVSPPNDDSMGWNYHVATKVNVQEEDGKIQGYVIDPSVAKRPLLEKEWLELISTSKTTAQMKTTWPPTLNTGAVKNIKVSYTPNEIYAFYERFMPLPDEILKMDREDALRTNETYRSYLNENK